MRTFARAVLSALLFFAVLAVAKPVSAYADVGISFGFMGPGTTFDPCDYYDYYDQPPPWGLPADYCAYPVYFEPVYYNGFWYRGPIYYRWYRGQRMFWLNGGWHRQCVARRRAASGCRLAEIAAVGTTDFARACIPPRASGQCRVRGAACRAVVRRGSIAVRAGSAACIPTAVQDPGRAACGPMAEGLLHAADLAAGIPVVARDMVAAINAW